MNIEQLTDGEIEAAIVREGWVLNGKESAKAFRALAKEIAYALWRKNNVDKATKEFADVGHE